MKKKWLVAVAVFAIFGIVLAGISIQNFLRIQKSGFEVSSFCSVSESINCDIVDASSYAELFGMPVAGFGLAFYLVVLLFSLFAIFSNKERKAAVSFMWWVSFFGIGCTLYMAYVASFILRVICVTCGGMYLANIVIFIGLYASLGRGFRSLVKFAKDYIIQVFSPKSTRLDFAPKLPIHLFIAASIFFIVVAFVRDASTSRYAVPPEKLKEMVDIHFRQSLYDIKIDEARSAMWGNPKAKVTIIEISDFQCPFCKVAAFRVKPYLREFKNKVRFFFVNYPLDSSCNKYVQSAMHPQACLAARAAICANQQGKFWRYQEDLFKNQRRLSPEMIVKLARQNRLDANEFQSCLESQDTTALLASDIENAGHIHTTGVPAIFINNRPLRPWQNPEILRAVVKKEIGLSR